MMEAEDLLPQGGLEYDEAKRIAAVIEAAEALTGLIATYQEAEDIENATIRLVAKVEAMQAARSNP